MSLARNLKIYEDTYQFVKELSDVYKNMDRIYKQNIGNKLLNDSLSLFGHIELANRTEENKQRTYHQTQYLILLESIRTLLRLCSDLKLISLKKHASLCGQISNIGKQMTAWKNK